MTVGDIPVRKPHHWQIYKDGTLYVAIGKTGVIEYENTDFLTLYNLVKADVGSKGQTIALEAGNYQLATGPIPYASTHNTAKIISLDHRFRTTFEPLGDFPVFDLDNVDYMEMENLGFVNNQTTRTAPFINLKDGCQFGRYNNLYMISNVAGDQGFGIQFEAVSGGGTYYNRFFQCSTRNMISAYKAKSSASTVDGVWINSNSWIQCDDFNSGQFLKLDQKPGIMGVAGGFDNNVFLNCEIQCDSLTNNIFDLDSGYSNIHIGGGSMAWDQSVTNPVSIKLGPLTRLSIGQNSNFDLYLGGSGYNNGARISRTNVQSSIFGESSFTGDGIQTDFVITHNLGLNNQNKVPKKGRVWSGSVDANLALPVSILPNTITSTEMTARFSRPPRSPNPSTVTNNVKLFWEVDFI